MADVVYTYYEEVPELVGQIELLELWAQSWQRYGWTPVVLTDVHARRHPLYEQKIREWEELPAANYARYDLACYKRWLALGSVGGGIIVDYDVCNTGFRAHHPVCSTPEDVVMLTHLVPCAVRASAEGCLRIASWFVNDPSVFITAYGKAHVSDMLFFQRHIEEIARLPICFGLSELGAEQGLLIHVSHHDVSAGAFADGYRPASKADAFEHHASLGMGA